MGISLWQHKSTALTHNASKISNEKQAHDYIKQTNEDLAVIAKQVIFSDILLSFGLSIGEVYAKDDHLDLGLFNWYFSKSEPKENPIHCANNNLVSPSIEEIAQSSKLKKQLWHTMNKHLL